MSILLDFVYLLAAVFASPWLAYRLIARGDWRGLPARFGAGLGPRMHASIWLHGSSAGEIALLVPLVRLLEQGLVANPLVISAYSATGIVAARRAFPRHRVILFPFDLSFVVGRVLRCLDPRLIVIVESEFWPNFLRVANRHRVPIAVINGKMSAKSFRFYSRTRVVPMLLRRLTLLAVQTTVYEQRLRALGIAQERIRVTGNMKYDLAKFSEGVGSMREMRRRLGFGDEDTVIIGGSVHEGEDAALIDAYLQLRPSNPRVHLVLVPRYPRDAGRIEQLAAGAGVASVRKTTVDREPGAALGKTGILIVDTVGELRQLYGIADIAFVGGSLFYRGSNRGGHNLMEPAILGVPVVFGPYNFSFKDTARDLLDAEAAFEARDVDELGGILRRLVGDAELRRACGRRAKQVIVAGQGATRKNLDLLAPLIDAAGLCLPASDLSPTMPPAVSDVD